MFQIWVTRLLPFEAVIGARATKHRRKNEIETEWSTLETNWKFSRILLLKVMDYELWFISAAAVFSFVVTWSSYSSPKWIRRRHCIVRRGSRTKLNKWRTCSRGIHLTSREMRHHNRTNGFLFKPLGECNATEKKKKKTREESGLTRNWMQFGNNTGVLNWFWSGDKSRPGRCLAAAEHACQLEGDCKNNSK